MAAASLSPRSGAQWYTQGVGKLDGAGFAALTTVLLHNAYFCPPIADQHSSSFVSEQACIYRPSPPPFFTGQDVALAQSAYELLPGPRL